jgi:lysophospholipase L1-like esterase
LAQSGVTHVILEHGTNDIGLPEIGFILPEGDSVEHVTGEQLIAGMKQATIKAHSRNIKIIGGTLLPFKGAIYYTEEGEAKRQILNEWTRTSNAFDGYVDFDLALRDPADPQIIRADLQISDNLHPQPIGLQGDGRCG